MTEEQLELLELMAGTQDDENTLWLIRQARILSEVKELINDERITKSETVDKISKIIN